MFRCVVVGVVVVVGSMVVAAAVCVASIGFYSARHRHGCHQAAEFCVLLIFCFVFLLFKKSPKAKIFSYSLMISQVFCNHVKYVSQMKKGAMFRDLWCIRSASACQDPKFCVK